jgi:hypothetical protein
MRGIKPMGRLRIRYLQPRNQRQTEDDFDTGIERNGELAEHVSFVSPLLINSVLIISYLKL